MKNIVYISTSLLLLLGACQTNTSNNSTKPEDIGKEVIIVHDEIMPQIAHFDRTTLKIDSLIATSLEDSTKIELTQLKSNLEAATGNMMTWMRDYAADSADISYQESELTKIKVMKKQFEDVSLESNTKLATFK